MVKNSNVFYKVTASSLSIKNDNMTTIGVFYKNDLVQITDQPRIYNGFIRYKVSGQNKQGWVAGNWLKLVGEDCLDGIIDLHDFIKICRYFKQPASELVLDNYDTNKDEFIDITDIWYFTQNYSKPCYTEVFVCPTS